MIEVALVAHLEAAATSAGNRIYPVVRPENERRTCLTYQNVSPQRPMDHGGPRGLAEDRIQITAWGDDDLAVRTLRAEVRAALHGHTGNMQGVTVARVGYEGGSDGFDPGVGPQGVAGLYRAADDYLIQYTE